MTKVIKFLWKVGHNLYDCMARHRPDAQTCIFKFLSWWSGSIKLLYLPLSLHLSPHDFLPFYEWKKKILIHYHHHVVLLSHVFFSLVLLLLSHWWTPTLRLQVSDCSTFLMMCDVRSTAVFCRQSIECCPGTVRFF
jgi:hypothetical protein